MTGRLEWMDSALCAQTDPDAFFPDRGSHNPVARATCAACPVSSECYEWISSLGVPVREGMWAGKTERSFRGRRLFQPKTVDSRIRYMKSKGWTGAQAARELGMTEAQVHDQYSLIKQEEDAA